MKKIFRYLQGTKSFGITFKKTKHNMDLCCYSDSDWAGDSTRHTTACSVILLGGAPIHWKVRLLKNIALSSMEAELMALSEAGKDVIGTTKIIEEIGMKMQVQMQMKMSVPHVGNAIVVIRMMIKWKRYFHLFVTRSNRVK